jgi:predicted DNA-binding protein
MKRLTEVKGQVSVRVSQATVDRLQKASYILKRSQASIVEEVLERYFETLDLDERLELRQTPGHNVLVRVTGKRTDIVEVTIKNGVPPKELAEKYSVALQAPVTVVDPPRGPGGGSHEDAREDHAA